MACHQAGTVDASAGLVLQAFTPSLGAWFAARAAQGVASALVHVANMATGKDAVEDLKGNDYVDSTILVYSMFFGVICGAPFGGIGFSIQPFLPFLFLGLAELVLMMAIHFKAEAPSQAMQDMRAIWEPLKLPMFTRPLVLVCLLVMWMSALQAMVFKLLTQQTERGSSFTSAAEKWQHQAV